LGPDQGQNQRESHDKQKKQGWQKWTDEKIAAKLTTDDHQLFDSWWAARPTVREAKGRRTFSTYSALSWADTHGP